MKTKTKIILTCLLGSVFHSIVNAQSPTDPIEAAHQRIPAKMERAKEALQKTAEGGTGPSVILKTTEEKLGPLIEAGKFIEAEAELDRVLEQLKQDTK